MLVLARKPGEHLLIGADIEITVVSVRGNQVRIGIKAPPSVSVCRGEIIDRVRQENLAASRSAAARSAAAPAAAARCAAERCATRSSGAAALPAPPALKSGAPTADTNNGGAPARPPDSTAKQPIPPSSGKEAHPEVTTT